MIGTVAFINILALVAFALPQAKVRQDGTPQLLDDSNITPDGTICPAKSKDLSFYYKNDLVGLSEYNKRFCMCMDVNHDQVKGIFHDCQWAAESDAHWEAFTQYHNIKLEDRWWLLGPHW